MLSGISDRQKMKIKTRIIRIMLLTEVTFCNHHLGKMLSLNFNHAVIFIQKYDFLYSEWLIY